VNIERPLVSIVTITLNSADYLGDLIAAVEAQTYENIEHVLIDGESTDGTVDLIREYADRRRVAWISEPDSGTADAVTKGLRMATGDIVVILPSDDLIFPWSVKTAVDSFRAQPDVDVVHGDSISWDMPSGEWSLRLHKRFTYGYLARTQIITPQAAYFRSHVLSGNEELDLSLPHANDYEWILRITQNRKVVNIPEILAIFRKRPGAINRQAGISQVIAQEANEARSRYIRTSGPTYRLMRLWDRVYGAIHRRRQVLRLFKHSRQVSESGEPLKSGTPWRNFLNAYSVSRSSGGGLLSMILPGRRRYPVNIWSRPAAEHLGAAERPEKTPVRT
jgi:hypothetical protein